MGQSTCWFISSSSIYIEIKHLPVYHGNTTWKLLPCTKFMFSFSLRKHVQHCNRQRYVFVSKNCWKIIWCDFLDWKKLCRPRRDTVLHIFLGMVLFHKGLRIIKWFCSSINFNWILLLTNLHRRSNSQKLTEFNNRLDQSNWVFCYFRLWWSFSHNGWKFQFVLVVKRLQ